MDASRFDNLTRAVGRATSRRRAIALLAGGTAVFAVPALARGMGAVWAGERPRVGAGPQAMAVGQCYPDNVVPLPCDELRDYARECGTVCTDGRVLTPAYGCTVFTPTHRIVLESGGEPQQDPLTGKWVAVQTVAVEFRPLHIGSAVLKPRPPSVCCADECQADLDEWRRGVEDHENRHQLFAYGLLNEANLRWGNRTFRGTGNSPEAARRDLFEKKHTAIEAEEDEILRKWNSQQEPPPAGHPPCGRCQTKENSCDYCHGGTCRRSSCPPDTSCCHATACCTRQHPVCCEFGLDGQPLCCPPNEFCCGPDGGGCCPFGYECCMGDKCCPISSGAGAGDADDRPAVRQRTGR